LEEAGAGLHPGIRLHDAVATDRITVRDLLCIIPGCRVTIGYGCPAICHPRKCCAMRYLEPSEDIRSVFQYCNLAISSQAWVPNASRSELTELPALD